MAPLKRLTERRTTVETTTTAVRIWGCLRQVEWNGMCFANERMVNVLGLWAGGFR